VFVLIIVSAERKKLFIQFRFDNASICSIHWKIYFTAIEIFSTVYHKGSKNGTTDWPKLGAS